MARLPFVGGDDKEWGAVLNDYLRVNHGVDGALNSSTFADLPAAGTAGRLMRVTDDAGGIWSDTGTQWKKEFPFVNVKDAPFNAKGDGVTDDTAAIQAALNSGAVAIILPQPTAFYKIASSITVPNTVKYLFGFGGYRGGTVLKFTGSGTTAFTVDSDSIRVQGLFLTGAGSYTNGLLVSSGRHFGTYTDVALDATGAAWATNLWVFAGNNWSQALFHSGAWGDDLTTVGLTVGAATNSLDCYSCRFVHNDINVYLPSIGTYGFSYHGGEIASSKTYGVKIGNATSGDIESINFYGTYFEANPVNIYNNNTNTSGIGCYGCFNGDTATTAHIFLNATAYSVIVSGGSYKSSAGGSTLINVNNTASQFIVIDAPKLSGFASYYTNASNAILDQRGANTGTWSPSVGGTATYTAQQGFWTRIGDTVFITGHIQINAIGTGSTTTISGLPFTSTNLGFNQTVSVSYFANLATNVLFIAGYVPNSGTTIIFTSATAATATITNAPAIFGNGAEVFFSAVYKSLP